MVTSGQPPASSRSSPEASKTNLRSATTLSAKPPVQTMAMTGRPLPASVPETSRPGVKGGGGAVA